MHKVYKQIGETPLAALERFRRDNPEYAEARLSYAGRLDPMASGELLILEGEENDRREEYLGRDKKYEFQILFGAATDTFDLLGLVQKVHDLTNFRLTESKVQRALDHFLGEWQMPYPPYSSQTVLVKGKKVPLWQLARDGRLPEKLPTKKVEVYEVTCQQVREITGQEVLDYVHKHIPKVNGDFRQEEIITRWERTLSGEDKFLLADCSVSCSSGTYVRRLAEQVGKGLDLRALAFSINRENIS